MQSGNIKTSILSVCLLLAVARAVAQPGNDDLSADTILTKTKAAYAALSSVRIEGQVKHPWASPAAVPPEIRATLAPLAFTMLLARPCQYRVEAQTGMPGASGRVASWCDGKAHHQFYGRTAHRVETADKDQAVCLASGGALIFELFYETSVNRLMTVRGWKRVADVQVNGEPCYVVEAGGGTPLTASKMLLRVAQSDFLIREVESRTTSQPATDQTAAFSLQLAGQRATPDAIAKAKQEMQSPACAELLARMSTLVTYTIVETGKAYGPDEFAYALPEGMQELKVPPRQRPVPRPVPPASGNPPATPATKP